MPHVTVPVKTGRDLARLVEVAVMNQKLKDMGENSAVEFNQKLLHMISERRSRYWNTLQKKNRMRLCSVARGRL